MKNFNDCFKAIYIFFFGKKIANVPKKEVGWEEGFAINKVWIYNLKPNYITEVITRD